MGATDAVILGLLAIADMALLVHLRRRRARANRMRRMWKSLDLALRLNNGSPKKRRRIFNLSFNLAAR